MLRPRETKKIPPYIVGASDIEGLIFTDLKVLSYCSPTGPNFVHRPGQQFKNSVNINGMIFFFAYHFFFLSIPFPIMKRLGKKKSLTI